MGTTGQSITLANSIIGVGILAMPFCFQQCGVLLATSILLFMGLVSRLCCYFLLKSALLARRRNFEFLAFHVFGPVGKLMVEVGIIGFLMGTCIAYFVVVGDLGPQIISKMFNINQSDILRTSIMVVVSLVCVLPLGLLRNVDSLSNVSAATFGFYLCLVIKVMAESSSLLVVGSFSSAPVDWWRPAGLLQCVPIFSMALFCQTQLFEIFESLPSHSLEKMNVVTKNAINICTGVYFTLGIFGYIAFMTQDISGNILMSLSDTTASDVIKLGFVMSLAFSFPLIIFPCRASLYSLLYKQVHSSHHDHIVNHSIPERSFRCITVAIVAVSLFISLLIPNIELVLGLLGSTIGVLVCVVFPAACFVSLTVKDTNERLLAKGVLVLGVVIMVLGTYANLQAAELSARRDDRMTDERIDQIVEDFFQNQERAESNIQPNVQNVATTGVKEENKVKIAEDSVVQPPNPVPPETDSGEKQIKTKLTNTKEDIEPKVASLEKSPEKHPKNVNSKFNELKTPGDSNVRPNDDLIAPKEMSLQEKVREQLDFLKQKQLMETIKEYDKEQKELLKEQNEILDKIKKTKQEDANEEAKKIAVESIQKIANIAIQSLGGVTEKTMDKDKISDKKLGPLKVITNEALQKIAKQAVESIQAIKENNDIQASKEKKPDNIINIPHIKQMDGNLVEKVKANEIGSIQNMKDMENINNGNLQPGIAQSRISSPIKTENLPQNDNVAQNLPINVANKLNIDIPQPIQVVDQNIQTITKTKDDSKVPIKNNLPAQNDYIQNNLIKISQDNHEQIPQSPINVQHQLNVQNNNINPEAKVDQVANVEAPLLVKEVADAQIQENVNVQIPKNEANKVEPANPINSLHSHSPDEPQSYKQGEEVQNYNVGSNVKQNIANNVPLALAMNGHNQINNNQGKQSVQHKEYNNGDREGNTNKQNENVAINSASQIVKEIDSPVPRQKREVVDCTDKTTLQPSDKAICEKLVSSLADTLVQLPTKVDLNDVAFSKKLPLEMIHHVRSLKSYDDVDVKR